MPYKTTKKDFEVFKAESRKWVKYFGLTDWDMYYYHENQSGVGPNRASCDVHYSGKIVSLFFHPNWNYKPAKSEIKRVAFHEVCEVMTAPLCIIAESRFATQNEVDVANHYIIRILENTVFEGKHA